MIKTNFRAGEPRESKLIKWVEVREEEVEEKEEEWLYDEPDGYLRPTFPFSKLKINVVGEISS